MVDSKILRLVRNDVKIKDVAQNYEEPIDNILPTHDIKKLVLDSDDFDQPIDFLPDSLRELTLGKNFKQSLDKLPNGLTHLTLKGEYSYDLSNIPKSVTFLHLEYPKNIKIPDHIEYLSLGDSFTENIDFDLPKNLTHLSFGKYYYQSFTHYRFHYSFKVVVSNTYDLYIPDSIDYIKIPMK